MPRPAVVCLTPTKDESEGLPTFLAAASTWADRIIVADQGSEDGTREIAAAHPKVELVVNPSRSYDEVGRQRLLLDAARRIPGPKLLMALDVDEVLVGARPGSPSWEEVLAAPSGTPILLPWLNLLPGGERAWVPPERVRFGLVDDGGEHTGSVIHSARLPVGTNPPMRPDGLAVMHLQYLDWEAMKSKQRWYQSWETLQFPTKRAAHIYRQYHNMDAIPEAQIHPVSPHWLDPYRAEGIDVTGGAAERSTRWDPLVLDLLAEHGEERFRRLDIWSVDWSAVARQHRRSMIVEDPRQPVDKIAIALLERTQRRAASRHARALVKAIEVLGW